MQPCWWKHFALIGSWRPRAKSTRAAGVLVPRNPAVTLALEDVMRPAGCGAFKDVFFDQKGSTFFDQKGPFLSAANAVASITVQETWTQPHWQCVTHCCLENSNRNFSSSDFDEQYLLGKVTGRKGKKTITENKRMGYQISFCRPGSLFEVLEVLCGAA